MGPECRLAISVAYALEVTAAEEADGAIVQAISITDNPSGTPAVSAEILCTKINELGIEPLVHFT